MSGSASIAWTLPLTLSSKRWVMARDLPLVCSHAKLHQCGLRVAPRCGRSFPRQGAYQRLRRSLSSEVATRRISREGSMSVNWLFVPCLTIALSVPATTRATAQDYPTRQVTIVVPFTPGGTTDILGRLFAQKLEQRLGKPFIVENRPGAGMQIGTT